MQSGGGTEDTVGREIVFIAVIGDDGTGFAGDDRACGDIIFLKGELPVSVKSAGGNQTQIIGGGTGSEDGSDNGGKFIEIRQIIVFKPRTETGESGSADGMLNVVAV